MSETTAVSRRSSPRIGVHVPATIAKDRERVICTLVDLSAIGARATCDRALEEMSLVGLQFHLACPGIREFEVKLSAAIVRCAKVNGGTYELGLYFCDIAPETREKLSAFIAQIAAAPT